MCVCQNCSQRHGNLFPCAPSTTAGNVGRPYAASAAPSALPSHSWALSLKSGSATAAMKPSQTKSKSLTLPLPGYGQSPAWESHSRASPPALCAGGVVQTETCSKGPVRPRGFCDHERDRWRGDKLKELPPGLSEISGHVSVADALK